MAQLPARPLELRGSAAERLAAARELAGHGREVRRLVREVGPDLLLAWGMRTAIVATAAAVATDRRPAILVRHVDFLPGPSIARLMRASVARADRVVVNSQAVARDLDPDGSLGERLSVISPGIDLSDYDAEWDTAPEPEVLLLGALMPWKRPDLALEAVAAGAGRAADGRGRADERRRRAAARLPARARRATRPRRPRRRSPASWPDPRPALGRAWCLLHCADREPFGNVVLQALASGRAGRRAASGGPAEIVDESCGRLYRPGDAEAAATALTEVLSSAEEVERLGAGGRARASWFEADEAHERFAELATAAVASRTAPRAAARAPPPGRHPSRRRNGARDRDASTRRRPSTACCARRRCTCRARA